MARQYFFKIYLCEEIFEEIKRVLLTYPHIREQYSYSNRQVAMFCQGLRDATNLVTKIPVIKVVANVPSKPALQTSDIFAMLGLCLMGSTALP